MGLDIVAYSKLVLESNGDREEGNYNVGCFYPQTFKQQYEPLIEGQYYKSENDSISFKAGSYGGYNHWRNQLAQLIYKTDAKVIWEDIDKYRGKPFINLIHFSDCEGTIGSVASKQLAKDFQDYQYLVDEDLDVYFKEKYSEWRNAFELASDDGAVVFC